MLMCLQAPCACSLKRTYCKLAPPQRLTQQLAHVRSQGLVQACFLYESESLPPTPQREPTARARSTLAPVRPQLRGLLLSRQLERETSRTSVWVVLCARAQSGLAWLCQPDGLLYCAVTQVKCASYLCLRCAEAQMLHSPNILWPHCGHTTRAQPCRLQSPQPQPQVFKRGCGRVLGGRDAPCAALHPGAAGGTTGTPVQTAISWPTCTTAAAVSHQTSWYA